MMTTTKMTSSMRRSLELRLADLNERIATLEAQREGDDSVETTALLLHLTRERGQITDALRDATLIDDDPFDIDAIEIGDVVTIRDDDGVTDRYVLVEEGVRSRVHSDWVSASSPLGAALLGRSLGDRIKVASPQGPMSYVVLDFERASDAALVLRDSRGGDRIPSSMNSEAFLG
jgi:transcription elongation GreA/GreB family factor